MLALQRLSIRLGSTPIPFGSPLAQFTFEFYTKLYGERTKVDFIQVRSVIRVGGDLYRFMVPVFYGRCRLTLKELVPDLTEELFDTLSQPEKDQLNVDFHFLFENLNFIASISHPCMADLEVSTNHMLAHKPAYGLSRWSSLQAAEKYLKNFIQEAGGNFKYTHDLHKLASQACKLGLPEIDDETIKAAQCDAAVRYELPSSKQQAVSTHYAAIKILAHIGKHEGHISWA
jgi:hypothetical protein